MMWVTKRLRRPGWIGFSLVAALLALTSGCPDVDVRQTEVPTYDGPTVEFNPAAGIIPFPNDLLLDPSTGLVAIPAPCAESELQQELRVGVLNTLDGFGTYEPALQVTFTETIDVGTLAGHVHLIEIGGDELPITTRLDQSTRANSECSASETVALLTIVPLQPLRGSSEYVVALTQGIATADSTQIIPSVTFSLVRQVENPVTVVDGVVVAERTPFDIVDDAQALLGLNRLWSALAPALGFLDDALSVDRSQLLIAWQFRTQTTTAPLDLQVVGSVAAKLAEEPLVGVASITGANTAEEFLAGVLGADACTAVGCAAVGDVVAGLLVAPNYQAATGNALAGGAPVPGPWSDPIAPTLVDQTRIPFFALIPATPPPPKGYPLVVFGHGLTRSRADLFAIGPQLASAGVASIAIDWVAHGSRAVQTSNQVALGCAGTPDPGVAPQCFAPPLSSNLATTRDNLRQSALDTMALIKALGQCTGFACNALVVDAERIGYLGHSLGGFLGAVSVAASPELRVAVLNAGGVGWVDFIERTASLGIRCPIVDALIGAGLLEGEGSDLSATPPTGTCIGESWRSDPGWLRFANIARWILDPADGANFVSLLGDRPVLIQEVIDDQIVPNLATERLGALLGALPVKADPSVSPGTISTAIRDAPTASKLLQYPTLPPDASTGFPGNRYAHGSLLQPAGADGAGALGTALMQRDAITYLLNNL